MNDYVTCPDCGWELHSGGVYDVQLHLKEHIAYDHWFREYNLAHPEEFREQNGTVTSEGLCLD